MTTWVALSEVTTENGLMRFIPGSHMAGLLAHSDTFSADNQLTRGQVLNVEVDESLAVTAVMQSGQFSLHHGSLFYASDPKSSGDRRLLGLAIRYIRPEMRQSIGHIDYARPVCGRDRFGHFRPEPEPAFALEPERLTAVDAMLHETNAYFYKDAGDRAPQFAAASV